MPPITHEDIYQTWLREKERLISYYGDADTIAETTLGHIILIMRLDECITSEDEHREKMILFRNSLFAGDTCNHANPGSWYFPPNNNSLSLKTKLQYDLLTKIDIWKGVTGVQHDAEFVNMLAGADFSEALFLHLILPSQPKAGMPVWHELLHQALSTWQVDKNIRQFRHTVTKVIETATLYIPPNDPNWLILQNVSKNMTFLMTVIQLEHKTLNLRERGEEQAANASATLANTLLQNFYEYHSKMPRNDSERVSNYDTFKENCTNSIRTAKPILEKHRGYKEILGNLALAIAGLGIFYLLAAGIHYAKTGNALFFKTDTEKKADAAQEALNNMRPGQ